MLALPVLMLVVCVLDVRGACECLARSELSLEEVFFYDSSALSGGEVLGRQLVATDLFLKALIIAADVCVLVFLVALALDFFLVDARRDRLLVKLYERLQSAGLVPDTEVPHSSTQTGG